MSSLPRKGGGPKTQSSDKAPYELETTAMPVGKEDGKISLTRQIIAILEARGPTEIETQLRYRPEEIEANRKRLAKDLVRVGRLSKKSDAEILDSVRKHNPAAAQPQPDHRQGGASAQPPTPLDPFEPPAESLIERVRRTKMERDALVAQGSPAWLERVSSMEAELGRAKAELSAERIAHAATESDLVNERDAALAMAQAWELKAGEHKLNSEALAAALRQCKPLLEREFERSGTAHPDNYERVCLEMTQAALAAYEGSRSNEN